MHPYSLLKIFLHPIAHLYSTKCEIADIICSHREHITLKPFKSYQYLINFNMANYIKIL
jgi:hypothetical protein